ncbi:hypothetical protein AAE026_20540 [Bradyrhizobium sp. DN5]|uniref:hypothetical protein n=1 Tax=Bradyrhizobium sp. DN5 TaxID=3056950 RepID=UPI003524616A
MTKTSFGRFLSANALSSFVGTGIQAATAPIFLLVLSVGQYATILLAQTVATYIAFFLNGFYYFMMNSITHDCINNRREQAQEIYTLGYLSILVLCTTAIVGAATTLAALDDPRSTAMLIWVAVLGSAINLGYILVDTNFRVANEYALGVNLLTVARLVDFVLLVSVLALTKDLLLSLLFNVCTRTLTIILLKTLAENRSGALSIGTKVPSPLIAIRYLRLALGQAGLSAYTALAVMGPQLVASSFFSDTVAVAFNVHRTYMRVVAALANIATASSWPVLNTLHASGRPSELAAFLSKLVSRSLGITSIASVFLFFGAPWAFSTLFHNKVPANSEYLVLIGLACVFNSGTTIAQALYLATNLRSTFVLIAFLLTATELVLMVVIGIHVGFTYGLLVYAAFELAVLISALIGCSRTIRREQQIQAK